MELFALDIGNRQVKIKSEKTLKVLPAYFVESSKYGDRMTMNLRGGKRQTSDYVSNKDDAFTYVWGKDLDVDIVKPTDSIGFTNRYESREFKLLVDFALAELARDYPHASESMLEVVVVTGVPTGDYMQNEILFALSKAIKGDHSVVVDDLSLNIRVKEVFVVPQPMGTVIDAMVDDQGVMQENPIEEATVGIADIGGGTLLIDLLRKMNMETNKREQLLEGAYTLYESIKRELNSGGHHISVYEIEQMVREGSATNEYYWSPNGKTTLDFTQVVMRERIKYTRDTASSIKAVYKEFDRMQAVLVTGGAANLLVKSEFASAIPNAVFVNDSETANVRGFYKYGLLQGVNA